MTQSAGGHAAPQSGVASKQECLAGPALSRDIRFAVSRKQVLFHFHPSESALPVAPALRECWFIRNRGQKSEAG